MKVTWSARARTRLADFHPARCFTWYSSHGHDQSGLTAGFSKRLRVRRTSESSTAIDLLMLQNEPILAELNHKRNNNDLDSQRSNGKGRHACGTGVDPERECACEF